MKIHNKSEHGCSDCKKLKKDDLCWEVRDVLGGGY
jgi:hypothetical protein